MILVPVHTCSTEQWILSRQDQSGRFPAGPCWSHNLAISVGLLLGEWGILSVSLPVGEPGRAVPLWLDVIAAGVAVAAFSVFFSTPLRMLGGRRDRHAGSCRENGRSEGLVPE